MLRRNSRLGVSVLLSFSIAATMLISSASAKRSTPKSWAKPEIKVVVAHGLMAKSVAKFKPNAKMTRQATKEVLSALPTPEIDTTTETDTTGTTTGTAETTTTPVVTDPSRDPSTGTTTTETAGGATPGLPRAGAAMALSTFDAALVRQLALTEAADRFLAAARDAGLKPPKRFGTETVARLLGLRINHPVSQDKLELLPGQKMNRAEAAYSFAQMLSFDDWEAQSVDQASTVFELPDLNVWQRRVLRYAVKFIGYPYIWGGISPKRQTLFGKRVPGGFDCSGLIWRVYKLHKYPHSKKLSSVIRGRTTYVMSGEVGRRKRIRFDNLQPADVLFFGARGVHSKPSQVNHTGIYLGNGWFIQSSGNGVDVVPLEGWYAQRFAWARRPLAEAGLVNVYSVSG
jgi:cell wall-associated NlpC family hydrolase